MVWRKCKLIFKGVKGEIVVGLSKFLDVPFPPKIFVAAKRNIYQAEGYHLRAITNFLNPVIHKSDQPPTSPNDCHTQVNISQKTINVSNTRYWVLKINL